MKNSEKNITEFTTQELKDAGFEAYQNRELASSQIENANRAINIINQELNRRNNLPKNEDAGIEEVPFVQEKEG